MSVRVAEGKGVDEGLSVGVRDGVRVAEREDVGLADGVEVEVVEGAGVWVEVRVTLAWGEGLRVGEDEALRVAVALGLGVGERVGLYPVGWSSNSARARFPTLPKLNWVLYSPGRRVKRSNAVALTLAGKVPDQR